MCLRDGRRWKLTVTGLRITSNVFFSQYLFTVTSSHVVAHPLTMFINRWDNHDRVCAREPEGLRSLPCSLVLLGGNGLCSLDFFNCCVTKLADPSRWLSFIARRTGTPSEPRGQQDCILLAAIPRWWPLQQVRGPSRQTNTIVSPCWLLKGEGGKARKATAQDHRGRLGHYRAGCWIPGWKSSIWLPLLFKCRDWSVPDLAFS